MLRLFNYKYIVCSISSSITIKRMLNVIQKVSHLIFYINPSSRYTLAAQSAWKSLVICSAEMLLERTVITYCWIVSTFTKNFPLRIVSFENSQKLTAAKSGECECSRTVSPCLAKNWRALTHEWVGAIIVEKNHWTWFAHISIPSEILKGILYKSILSRRPVTLTSENS